MFTFLTGFIIGLLVGWNFVEQPQFVKDLIAKIKG